MQHRITRDIAGVLMIGLLLAVFGARVCVAQDNPIVPVEDTDVIKPQPVCTSETPLPLIMQAHVYEMLGPKIRARGSLLFLRGNQHIGATEAEYDVDTQIGRVKDVFFTTCTAKNPDWHITAADATMLPNHRLHLRNVALYAGRTRLLMLPSMKLRVGGRAATASVFPRPGYDARDGVTLAQTLRLTDTTRSRTNLNLKFTTLHSVEGELSSLYGVGGRLMPFPGRFLTYGSMRSRALEVPQPPATFCDPQLLRPRDPARLQPFGTFTLRQRTYDANNLGLVVFRQPELGASYVAHQVSLTHHRLDPRIELYPQIVGSWGRFKEIPGGPDYIARSQVSVLGSFNAVWLGPKTSIQPLGIATYASYGDGQAFRTWGYGVDVAHIANDGSYYSARYIGRTSSGSTPFQFDNIDISKEIDVAAQTYFGKNVAGIALNYNATSGTLFDWEVLYGQRSDCLGTYFRWDNRFQRFSFDIVLINF